MPRGFNATLRLSCDFARYPSNTAIELKPTLRELLKTGGRFRPCGKVALMKYTTQHAQAIFNVSHTTIKNWTKEFAEYLSPTATPEANKARQFTEADLAVLALIAELKANRSASFEDIHFALRSGQRGTLPESITTTLAPTSTLITGLNELQIVIEDLKQQLENERAEKFMAKGKVEILEKQLQAAQERIIELSVQLRSVKPPE